MNAHATTRSRAASWPRVLTALAFCLAGCGGDDDDSADPKNDPFGNAPPPSAGSSSDPAMPGAGSGSGAGPITGGGDLAGMAACKHVDLVIAVDGSSSMTEELEAMRNDVFPKFATRLRELGANLDDFRVATLDACPDPANFHSRGNAGECNFEGGHNWIESSSSALDAEFACVGDIFLGDQNCSGENDDEQPATAAATALEEPAASSLNQGFRRDDALLIVLAITDEDEQPTGDTRSAEELYARLARLVATDPRRMVFVGIGGSQQCEGTYGEADPANMLQELTGLFATHDRGVFWDLCQGRLEDGLDEAFRVIDTACDELCGGLDVDCGTPPPMSFCSEIPDDPACSPD